MVCLSYFACILLLTFGWQQQFVNCNPFLLIKDVIEYPLAIYQDYKQLEALISKPDVDKVTAAENRATLKLNRVLQDIDSLTTILINKITNDLTDKITDKTNVLFKEAKEIEFEYNSFVEFVRNTALNPKSKPTVYSSLQNRKPERVHEALIGKDIHGESILTILSGKTDPSLICAKGQSMQFIIHELFKIVVKADSQDLIIKLYNFQIEKNLTNITPQLIESQSFSFNKRLTETYKQVKDAMMRASRELWRCDPPNHELGVTYDKLQEVFQGYIHYKRDNAANMCFRQAPDDKTDVNCKSVHCSKNHGKKACNGYLMNCDKNVDKKTFCFSKDNSPRRYGWMKVNDMVYGRNGTCKKDVSEVSNEYHHLTGFVRGIPIRVPCHYNFCTCVSQVKDIDRYISLSPVVSDIESNMVITGVRLQKANNTFYIEIQQGKLGANGTIDSTTTHWKKSEPSLKDSDLFNVTWDRRTVFLDTIDPQKNKSVKDAVLTGLQFTKSQDSLMLNVYTTTFDYNSGKLDTKRVKSNALPRNEDNINELVLEEPDDPLRKFNHVDDTTPNNYVKFQTTDMVKDLSQSTIPFFDIQEIVANPPTPLSGAGIFHKGSKGSGGFLALKLIQFDFTSHL